MQSKSSLKRLSEARKAEKKFSNFNTTISLRRSAVLPPRNSAKQSREETSRGRLPREGDVRGGLKERSHSISHAGQSRVPAMAAVRVAHESAGQEDHEEDHSHE